jgi:protein gp37
MNRTAIEWTDYTWNPLTGCTRGCPHCYARRMAQRLRGRYGYPKEDPFKVTFHPERLSEPRAVKKPAKIFTCSMGEPFDPTSRYGWIHMILAEMSRSPQHTFQILTQRAEALWQFTFPDNCWVGVTVKRNSEAERIKQLLDVKLEGRAKLVFASFEPILEDLHVDLHALDWIIIGAQTGTKKKTFEDSWIDRLVYEALVLEIPVFMKDNLWKQGYKGQNLYQQFPKGGDLK